MLQQLIVKDFKIEKNNQRLYTKKGIYINSNSKIENFNDMKKTFAISKTDNKNT
jgi:hypothetical protein